MLTAYTATSIEMSQRNLLKRNVSPRRLTVNGLLGAVALLSGGAVLGQQQQPSNKSDENQGAGRSEISTNAATTQQAEENAKQFRLALNALTQDKAFRKKVEKDPAQLSKKYKLSSDQVKLLFNVWLAVDASAGNNLAVADCGGVASCCCCCCC